MYERSRTSFFPISNATRNFSGHCGASRSARIIFVEHPFEFHPDTFHQHFTRILSFFTTRDINHKYESY